MPMVRNGEQLNVTLAMVKEIRDSLIVFSVHNEEIEIHMDSKKLAHVKEIIDENEYALIPVDLKAKTVLFDGEISETKLVEELQEATRNEEEF